MRCRSLFLCWLPFISLSTIGCADGEADQSDKPRTFSVRIENVSGNQDVPTPIAPGLWVLHGDITPFFRVGRLDDSRGLEQLAEDGSPRELAVSLGEEELITGGFDTDSDGYDDGAIMPGQSFEFEVDAKPGERLSLAAMFVESNDFFFATPEEGVALFSEEREPLEGDIEIHLYDAGTEVDQPLGEGPDQPLRQSAPNTGEEEGAPVEETDLNAGDYIRVTLTVRE